VPREAAEAEAVAEDVAPTTLISLITSTIEIKKTSYNPHQSSIINDITTAAPTRRDDDNALLVLVNILLLLLLLLYT